MRMKLSWVRSSACSRPTRPAHSCHTSGWARRTNERTASASPAPAARASRVRSSTEPVWTTTGAGNHPAPGCDRVDMSCDPFRELISADLDGEATETERTELATHLATCDAC